MNRIVRQYPEYKRRYRTQNPKYVARELARSRVRYEVRAGRLVKPKTCSTCGDDSKRIEAHHPNGYEGERVFQIVWLCSTCHMSEHRK